MNPSISLIDLAAQQRHIRPQIDAAIQNVLNHGQYIMGPEINELEAKLAEYSGVKHAITCSSGTDALMLSLMALDIKPGDGVIVPSFSFAATAEVLPCFGAIPIFADIDPITFNLNPDNLSNAIAAANSTQIKTKGIISVGLFGQPSDYHRLQEFADKHGLWILDDAAQSYGASWEDKPVGHLGEITATSFFPAKPLGCYGDGGAVFTDNEQFAEIIRSARIHGMGRERYSYDRIGLTARLDSIQAAILLEKLKLFPDELKQRQKIANRYHQSLCDVVETPQLAPDATSSWAQYTIKLPHSASRQAIQENLSAQGIPTAIYYPKGMHEHKPYAHYPIADGGLPVTLECCARVLALPMHPYLDEETQDIIVSALKKALTA